MIHIELTQGYWTFVEENDADLAQFKWSLYKNRSGNKYAIRDVRIDGETTRLLLHRVIAERLAIRILDRYDFVDHKDGNGLNNARANLRLCTQSQNMQNRRGLANTQSGFKGVSPNVHSKINPWNARIRVKGRLMHLGSFPTAELAHLAYCAAAQEYFGEFWRAA